MLDLSRRAFLRLTSHGGFSCLLAHGRPEHLVSPVRMPEYSSEKRQWIKFSTTCRECPAGCGMHLWHRDGRITKAEGNPAHPVNRGGLCARGQSALQGEYDPDRLRRPRRRGSDGQEESSWEDVLTSCGELLRRPKRRLLVISTLETGPLREIMSRFAGNFDGTFLLFEPFHYAALKRAHGAVFGKPVIPYFDLGRCRNILSLSADFLESWISNVEFASLFSEVHSFPDSGRATFNYVGPRLSMTAANADQFVQVPPSRIADAALAMLDIAARNGWMRQNVRVPAGLAQAGSPDPELESRIEPLAEAFFHRAPSAALAGPAGDNGPEAERIAAAAAYLNQAAGNVGTTIDFSRSHALTGAATDQEAEAALSEVGPEDVVILNQVNLAYTRPAWREHLERAGTLIYLGSMPDETSRLADWVLPIEYPLESWGEYEPWSGLRSLMQPTLRPLGDVRHPGDIFLSLADIAERPVERQAGSSESIDFASWLFQDWQDHLRTAGGSPSDGAVKDALRKGFLEAPPPPATPIESAGQQIPAGDRTPELPRRNDSERLDLWLWPSIFFFDGRTANRSWLQEAPHPVSFIAWGSWVDIHPRQAEQLSIEEGDLVRIESDFGSIRTVARVTDETQENTVSVPFGQGHQALGETAASVGANAFQLLDPAKSGELFASVTIERVGASVKPIYLSATRDQHEREVLRWVRLSELDQATAGMEEIDSPTPEGFSPDRDLYAGHEHADHRWAMVIDLQRCIGCGACAVACYAENNIPVLGPGPVREGREMGWLKVVPYFHPEKKGSLAWIPLPCQQCDAAPCEPVCPVHAAVHNEEGLNSQVYQRCIGTRYCSNNCPYKVRKFNWFNTTWKSPLDWQLNPEVTVRSRGVMEKCTFCVQRIRKIEYRARRENRSIRDGEIQPACVDSCPTRALIFGDLLDPESQVAREFRSNRRRYQLLKELNTKPAVVYLKKVDVDTEA